MIVCVQDDMAAKIFTCVLTSHRKVWKKTCCANTKKYQY